LLSDRAPVSPHTAVSANTTKQQTFCHDFDLSKRLVHPFLSQLNYVPQGPQTPSSFDTRGNAKSPFLSFIESLVLELSKAPKSSIHRIIIPGLLSPAIYANTANVPEHFLQFLHSLRALLRIHPSQLTAFITLPLTLHPRGTGLTRWAEILSDGVIELTPFPTHAISPAAASSGSATGQDETPQGMLKVHRLPILHEKGSGGSESNGFGDDLAFTLSRRKGLVIKPFSLPPVDGDTDAQHAGMEGSGGGASRFDIEF
jgi:elongator complex protein 4